MAQLNTEEKLILETMSQQDKPLKTADIVNLTGIEKQKVSKIISKLKKLDLVYSPKRCYYKAK